MADPILQTVVLILHLYFIFFFLSIDNSHNWRIHIETGPGRRNTQLNMCRAIMVTSPCSLKTRHNRDLR